MEAITLKDKQMGVISGVSTDVHAGAHTHIYCLHTHINTYKDIYIYIYYIFIYIHIEWGTVNAVQKFTCDEWGQSAGRKKAHRLQLIPATFGCNRKIWFDLQIAPSVWYRTAN